MMLTTNLLFVNCGGAARTSNNSSNNGTGNDTGGDGDVSLEDLSVLEGGWIMGRCSVYAAAASLRHFYQFTQTSETRISHVSNQLMYSNNSCASPGSHMGATNFGNVEFDSTVTYGTRKFFRGTWTAPSGSVQEMIYAFKTPTLICIFSDTGFTNAASINSYVNQVSDLDCFSKYN